MVWPFHKRKQPRQRRPANVHVINRLAADDPERCWHLDRRYLVTYDGNVEGYYGGVLRDVFGRTWIVSRTDDTDGTLWKPSEVQIERRKRS